MTSILYDYVYLICDEPWCDGIVVAV